MTDYLTGVQVRRLLLWEMGTMPFSERDLLMQKKRLRAELRQAAMDLAEAQQNLADAMAVLEHARKIHAPAQAHLIEVGGIPPSS